MSPHIYASLKQETNDGLGSSSSQKQSASKGTAGGDHQRLGNEKGEEDRRMKGTGGECEEVTRGA